MTFRRIPDLPELSLASDDDLLIVWDTDLQLNKSIRKADLITQSASGGSGLKPWLYLNAAGSYAPTFGDRLMIDTSSASWILPLPQTPSFGYELDIFGVRGLSQNKLKINLQGKKYKNIAASYAFYSSLYTATKIIYVDNDIGWIDTSNIIFAGTYPNEILRDSPYIYLRLGDTSGTIAIDSSGNSRHGTYTNNPTLGATGSLSIDGNTAVNFNGNNLIYFATSFVAPVTFTLECRFKTTALNGSLFCFGNAQQAGSGSFDRELYLDTGKLKTNMFGGVNLVSALNYNDGNWHTVTFANSSASGELWVDGSLVASNTNGNGANYTGYWHIGHGQTKGYFTGTIDEASITHSKVSQDQIKNRHSLAF